MGVSAWMDTPTIKIYTCGSGIGYCTKIYRTSFDYCIIPEPSWVRGTPSVWLPSGEKLINRVERETVQYRTGGTYNHIIVLILIREVQFIDIFSSSPSGKLVQIEYALQAVAAGAPSVGIKAKNGVVIAVEKKQKSVLYDESTIRKVCLVRRPLTPHTRSHTHPRSHPHRLRWSVIILEWCTVVWDQTLGKEH